MCAEWRCFSSLAGFCPFHARHVVIDSQEYQAGSVKLSNYFAAASGNTAKISGGGGPETQNLPLPLHKPVSYPIIDGLSSVAKEGLGSPRCKDLPHTWTVMSLTVSYFSNT
jgi:hypothetical protein